MKRCPVFWSTPPVGRGKSSHPRCHLNFKTSSWRQKLASRTRSQASATIAGECAGRYPSRCGRLRHCARSGRLLWRIRQQAMPPNQTVRRRRARLRFLSRRAPCRRGARFLQFGFFGCGLSASGSVVVRARGRRPLAQRDEEGVSPMPRFATRVKAHGAVRAEIAKLGLRVLLAPIHAAGSSIVRLDGACADWGKAFSLPRRARRRYRPNCPCLSAGARTWLENPPYGRLPK